MRKPANHIIVIFGASGDLTRRKLIPALYNLFEQNLLSEKFYILGVGRSHYTDDSYRSYLEKSFPENTAKTKLSPFLSKLFYLQLKTSDLQGYNSLKQKILSLEKDNEDKHQIIFYLATPPSLYYLVPGFLAEIGMNNPEHKIIIEKPFGYDYESALRLNQSISEHFGEDQVYRIDHYLGKETVQNILVTRFANTFFEPVWNRNFIHHVEITSAESIGVENRGGYYDQSGALRDMVQNHLLQLVALMAMEPPVTAEPESIRDEIVKVFKSFRPLTDRDIMKHVIRGQYTSSSVRNMEVRAYREEEGVPGNSRTETYAAMKFFIDNWRWSGVPFFIRTGKALPTRVTEIVIHFRPTPHHIFCNSMNQPNDSNQLVIRIQPDEGLLLKYGMKVPGAGFKVQNVNMDFHYSSLRKNRLPEAYERLLLDCMNNDSTLYSREDALMASWKFIDPVLKKWKEDDSIPLYGYPAGTWGPDVADSLIEEPGLTWRYPCKKLTDDGIFCEL